MGFFSLGLFCCHASELTRRDEGGVLKVVWVRGRGLCTVVRAG